VHVRKFSIKKFARQMALVEICSQDLLTKAAELYYIRIQFREKY
jgi:hypothetical protein